MSDPIPTHERTTTVNDNNTPDWDGALVVKDPHGTFWHRRHDGTYLLGTPSGRSAIYIEEHWGPITVVTPAPAPEPRTLTWRRDGTGCTWDELVAEFREGRQVERVLECSEVTITRRGPLEHGETGEWWIGGVYSVGRPNDSISVTVWLPEVPEWAQDCDDWLNDHRLVATDDGRVWEAVVALGGIVTRWRPWGSRDEASTEELAAMGARLLIDSEGKAVL